MFKDEFGLPVALDGDGGDTRCDWLKSMTRFGILGQKLTISYNNGQQMRVFDWNPPSQN